MSWLGKRHMGAGCAGFLLGIAAVLGGEAYWIGKDMQRMDEFRDAGLVRMLEEGPSQSDYDRMCGDGRKESDEKRKLACSRMEFLMQRAKARREAESASETPDVHP